MYSLDLENEPLVEYSGKIIFDPKALADPSGKMFKPWWVIVHLGKDNDFGLFYSWLYERQHGIILQRPAFGPHISVVRGEEIEKDKWESFKSLYHQKDLKFIYEATPRTNGKHVWLRVRCSELNDLREQMGYKREGVWGFHLTLGMPTPLYLERNYDVWRMYKNYGRNT